MKKILIAAIALTSISFTASAQQERATKDKMERTEKHADRKDMYADLNLTATQKTQLQAQRNDVKKQMEALKSQNLSKEQMQAQRKVIMDQQKAKMDQILTADQKATLAKKRAEMKDDMAKKGDRKQGKHGDMKEKGKEIKKELNLSDDQGQKLKALAESSHSQMKAVKDNTSLTEAQKKEQMKSIKANADAQRKQILTAEQLQKWEAMKGDMKGRHGKKGAQAKK